MKITKFDNIDLQGLDEDAELIPLLTPEDEEQMNLPYHLFGHFVSIDK